MTTPAVGDAPPPRNVLLIVVNTALAVWGLLAFVSGFLDRFSEDGEFAGSIKGFSYSSTTLLPAIALGTVGIIGAVSRRGPRQVYLLALAGAMFAVEVGELFTFGGDFGGESRGSGYWLLFVAVILELLTTAVGALVQTGVIAVVTRSDRPPPPGYVAGPPAYGQPPYGAAPYGGGYAAPPPSGGAYPPAGAGYTNPPPTGGGWQRPGP